MPCVNICVSMTEEALSDLKEIEERTGKSKSKIVREAIRMALAKLKESKNE